MRSNIVALSGLLVALMLTPALAQAPCGLCAKTVVINKPLAQCFLERYADLTKRAGGAVAVDLSECPGVEDSRGVVEALAAPTAALEQPDKQFFLSRGQLDCLKSKLEQPGLELDPSARIELEACK